MKKLIIIAVMLLSGVAFGQAYNPYINGRTNIGIQPSYQQPFADQHQQLTQQPVQKYNPMNRTWQTTYPDSQLKYNPLAKDPAKKWEYAPKNAQPVYNPFNNDWEYAR